MLDERREIRDKRCFELSSRTPFRDRLWMSFWRPVGSIGSIVVLFALVLITACTDYVSQIEDRYGEWETSSVTPQSSSSVTRVSSCSSAKLSSSVSSSSSLVGRTSCNVNTDENCMKDSRDGQTYKTVTIGTQTWIAQNLNYKTANSYCYNDSAKYCTKYGRLYTWAAAMDSAGMWSANGKGCGYGSTCSPTGTVRGVCPEGWHLPTQTEWNALITAVGGQSTAGKMLKSKSGWNSSGNSESGTDAYGFSALPAGEVTGNVYFGYEGTRANFWSSTGNYSYYACYMNLGSGFDDAMLDNRNVLVGLSVRCVKD